jgi:hypothetical protein
VEVERKAWVVLEVTEDQARIRRTAMKNLRIIQSVSSYKHGERIFYRETGRQMTLNARSEAESPVGAPVKGSVAD